MSNTALAKTDISVGEVAAYTPFRNRLVEIKQQNFKLVFDYSDPKGNKEARSHVYKLRQTKAAIEAARKKEKAESLEYGRKVDQEAKELSAEIEEMIEVHDKPLRELEIAEETRIAAIKQRVSDMTISAAFIINKTSEELRQRRDEIEAIQIDESFGEFADDAKAAKMVAVEYLAGAIGLAEKREQEAAELVRLREEAEKRKAEDHARAIRESAEKVEKERVEREDRARKEREAAEKRAAEEEAARIEQERQQAAEAERKRVEAETAERERVLKEEAESERRKAQEAEERRQREEREAEERRVREEQAAIAREEKARADERARIQQEAEKKAAEDAKREADKKHRGQIHSSIVAAIVTLDKGITEEQARAVVVGICGDLIPNIKIIY